MGTWKLKTRTYEDANGVLVTTNSRVGTAKLVQPLNMSEKGLMTKANGKTYRLCTVEIESPNGLTTQMLAQVPSRNIELAIENGVEFKVGSSFLTTLDRVVDKNDATKHVMFARMSHLGGIVTNADAEAEFDAMFADDVAEEVAEVKLAGAEVTE